MTAHQQAGTATNDPATPRTNALWDNFLETMDVGECVKLCGTLEKELTAARERINYHESERDMAERDAAREALEATREVLSNVVDQDKPSGRSALELATILEGMYEEAIRGGVASTQRAATVEAALAKALGA